MVTIYKKIVIDMSTMQTVYAESFEYKGAVALCGGALTGGGGGGGGSSGRVDYPDYIKKTHAYWLVGEYATDPSAIIGGVANDMDAAKTSAGGNPYAAAYAYDPTADMEDIESRYEDFNKIVSKLNTELNWSQLADNVESQLTSSVLSDNEIEALVTQFETEQRFNYNRAVNRFNAGMADINAVTSSAFTVGNALLEDELSRAVANFRSTLSFEVQRQRYNYVLQGIDSMMKAMSLRITADHTATHLYGEIKRLKTQFTREQYDMDLDISVKDATWDVMLYQHGANALSAAAGSAVSAAPDKYPNSQVRWAAALSGAGAGAMAGSHFLGPAGGAIGAFLGYRTGRSKADEGWL